jgi:DNA primase
MSHYLIHHLQVLWDDVRKMVVFPYYNVYTNLAGARGRSAVETGMKHFDYTYGGINNAALVWYNEQCLNLPGPVVVVEGQFDVAKVLERYPKVVGNLTAKPRLVKVKKLTHSPGMILIPDNDETGRASEKKYSELCNQLQLPMAVVRLSGVKDPGECHPDYLWDRLQPLVEG